MKFLQYHVPVSRDAETGQVVAEIPALQIADYGKDLPESLNHLEEMLRFTLNVSKRRGSQSPRSGIVSE